MLEKFQQLIEAKETRIDGVEGNEFLIIGKNAKKAGKEFEKEQQKIYDDIVDQYDDEDEDEDDILDDVSAEIFGTLIPKLEKKYKVTIQED